MAQTMNDAPIALKALKIGVTTFRFLALGTDRCRKRGWERVSSAPHPHRPAQQGIFVRLVNSSEHFSNTSQNAKEDLLQQQEWQWHP